MNQSEICKLNEIKLKIEKPQNQENHMIVPYHVTKYQIRVMLIQF